MSAWAVRQLARQWITDPAIGMPYHDTINTEQNPTDPQWVTLVFDPVLAERTTFCDNRLEEGEIRLVFFGQPGVGDSALLQAAETASQFFYRQVDPAGRLVLTQLSPPDEFREDLYVVEVPISYTYTT